MARIKVSIVIENNANFDTYAFKYFILALNKIQTFYELFFPDIDPVHIYDKVCYFETANYVFKDFVQQSNIIADYHILIISKAFDNNYFFASDDDTAILTTDIWDKYFSPPTLFEYLMHCIVTCLIYSQKLQPDTMISDDQRRIYIDSHTGTYGCIADFTRNKYDDRIDILLGYICETHQEQIRNYYGEAYFNEIMFIINRGWLGAIEKEGSVAYNLKHVFKFDINKDSGLNKSMWDKCKEKFYDIPGNLLGEVFKVVITAFITYLLIKYGIVEQSK